MLKKMLVGVGDYNDSSQTQLFREPIIDLDKIYSHLFPPFFITYQIILTGLDMKTMGKGDLVWF